MTIFAVVLVALGCVTGWLVFEKGVGIDFYQFWGIGLARQLGGSSLKPPYAEPSVYAGLLDVFGKEHTDIRFDIANRANHTLYRNGVDVTGTPLLYMLFSIFPRHYSTAYGLFLSLQVLFFTGTLLGLVAAFSQKKYRLMALSLALVGGYGPLLDYPIGGYRPLLSDLIVGNICSFQFSAIVALTFLCAAPSEKNVPLRNAVCLIGLALITLVKPSVFPVAVLLAASFWKVHGQKAFGRASFAACAAGASAYLASCAYFGSWTTWTDWRHYLLRESNLFSSSVEAGNASITYVLSNELGLDISLTTAAMAVLFCLSFLSVALKAGTSAKTFPEKTLGAANVLLKDPCLCAAIGIVAVLALSPLVWLQYYVLSLFPVFWLIGRPSESARPALMGLFSVFLSSFLLPALIPFLQTHAASQYLPVFAWLPLWIGILEVMTEKLRPLIFFERHKANAGMA